MWKTIVALVAVGMSPAVAAQSGRTSAPNFYVAQGSFNPPPRDDEFGGKGSECLVQRSSGRRVCHSRAEWVKIAANMQKRTAK